nr:unnamed protein product [Callosobruchus chinensis]
MNNSKKFLALANTACRQLARNASTETPPRWDRFQKIAKKLQMDESTPVYLKGGLGDKFLFLTTVALTVVGVGMGVETMYSLVYKK